MALHNIKFKLSKSGRPKVIIPIILAGKCPSTTAAILKTLSLEPLKIKFQKACKNAANKTKNIIKFSILEFPYVMIIIVSHL